MSKKKARRRRNDEDGFADSLALKIVTKLFLALVVIVTFLTITQCTVKKPESPQWVSQFTVPVISRTYGMEELVTRIDQEGVSIDSAGQVAFSIDEEFDPVALPDSVLRVNSLSFATSQTLGDVDITVADPAEVNVALTDISELALLVDGDSLVSPIAVPFTIKQSLDTVSSYETATIANGSVELVVRNNLGLEITGVAVGLHEQSDSSLIGSSMAASIPDGDSAVLPIDISGQTISNALYMRVSATVQPGTAHDVDQRSLAARTGFSDPFEVSSATAIVPLTQRDFGQTVNIDRNDVIDSARVSAGTLSLTLDNGSSLDATMLIAVPSLVSASGQPFVANVPVPGNSTEVRNFDLTNYNLVPEGAVAPQTVQVACTASVGGSGSPEVVASGASFDVDATLSELTFASVTGVFAPFVQDLEDISTTIDVPTGFDAIEMLEAILILEIDNGADVGGQLDVTIDGFKDGSPTNSLLVTGDIEPRTLATGGISLITNSDVATLLNPIPDSISVSGSVTVGGGSYHGTVRAGDEISGLVKIHAPMHVVIHESQVQIDDLDSVEIEQEDIDIITDHFVEGRFVYRLVNALPVGASVDLFFDEDSSVLYVSPVDTIGGLEVEAGVVDGNGLITAATDPGYKTIVLDSAQVRSILTNGSMSGTKVLYIGPRLTLEDSGGPVKMMQTDSIRVIGRIEVEYLFDGEF